ncbi:CesT family type III secretion system chaperone [Aquabacterium sp. A7-Y]|uniref:CesT family type III secretion system chaperone n=1 Tax=Aquabacterium sp. A7-Y TaxID=1349605 RepID=UPI00223CCD49|nr:CesT family type III secretion system chaperone [Aquabacterium sp. A7-Y]MCW7540811.1 CesT family type III secretion system chaperone [Aquabacterium sp. A7-Y]
MNVQVYADLVYELCHVIGLPDADEVLRRGAIEVEGFEVLLGYYDSDPQAMYLNFHFGIVTAGRSLRIFQLLLESNLTVYAQDQAQLGLNPDTGGVLLIVRIPLGPEVDGPWLAETLTHYTEHGRYWRDNLLNASDEMFTGLCAGDYFWLKA